MVTQFQILIEKHLPSQGQAINQNFVMPLTFSTRSTSVRSICYSINGPCKWSEWKLVDYLSSTAIFLDAYKQLSKIGLSEDFLFKSHLLAVRVNESTTLKHTKNRSATHFSSHMFDFGLHLGDWLPSAWSSVHPHWLTQNASDIGRHHGQLNIKIRSHWVSKTVFSNSLDEIAQFGLSLILRLIKIYLLHEFVHGG